MKVVIFISGDFNASVIWNQEGTKKLLEFRNTHNNVIKSDDGNNHRIGQATWVCVKQNNTDEEKADIEAIRKLPGYGTQFKETDSMPLEGGAVSLKQFGERNNQKAIDAAVIRAREDAKLEAEGEKQILISKMKRFAVLSAQVQKVGGEIAANADPALVEEFKQLKLELEISDEENI
jgi:hypothetical protein